MLNRYKVLGYYVLTIIFLFAISINGTAANVASNAVEWKASGVAHSSQTGDKAYDGNTQTKWTSDGSSSTSWLALDLGNTYDITQVVVKHASTNGEPTGFNTQAFEIQSGSSINGPWTTKNTFNNSGQSATTSGNVNFNARYVRLLVTDAGNDNHARIPELELHGTQANPPVTNGNIAPNSIAWKASSHMNGSEDGAKAYDKNTGTKWTSNGSSATSWLALDLGGAFDINKFIVRHASSGGETSAYNTQNYTLQSGTSLDGPWSDITTVNNSGQAASNTSNVNTTARYVRLRVNDAGIDNHARIPEFEVYGTPSSGGVVNLNPKGFVDDANCTEVRGWAYDPNNTSASIDVHFYVDGNYAGAVKADQTRNDVNNVFGITGKHGYNWAIPSQYKDGQTHEVKAYAINIPQGTNPEIGKRNFGPCSNSNPYPIPTGLSVTAPTCSNQNATFKWTNSGEWFVIDISTKSDFSSFHNKKVPFQTSTTGAGGFVEWLPYTGNGMNFQENTTYYWRIWNGQQHVYGPSFTTPQCGNPPPPPPPTNCNNIYGIHFWGPGARNQVFSGKTGWTVEIVNTNEGYNGVWGINPTKNLIQNIRNEGGIEPMVRINKGWGATIPGNSAEFDDFANQCANIVNELSKPPWNIQWFIIGNEPNLADENEAHAHKGVPADHYAACFKKCYAKIKAVAPHVKVMVAAPGPWNPQGPLYNLSGGGAYYDRYFERQVTQIGTQQDGYAIHTYGLHTEGADGNLISSYNNPNAWGFDAYKVFMTILKKYWYARTKPVHITETNTAHDWNSQPAHSYVGGWMQESFAKINQWNKTAGNQQILSLCWFVYEGRGGWGTFTLTSPQGNMNQGRKDFINVTASTNYIPDCSGLDIQTAITEQVGGGTSDDYEFAIEKLFPNPADDFVGLELSAKHSTTLSIRIFNAVGQEVSSKEIDVKERSLTTINIEELPSGLYTIQVSDGKDQLTQRLLAR